MTTIRLAWVLVALGTIAACESDQPVSHQDDHDAEIGSKTPRAGRGGASGKAGAGGKSGQGSAGSGGQKHDALARPGLPRPPEEGLPADLRPPR